MKLRRLAIVFLALAVVLAGFSFHSPAKAENGEWYSGGRLDWDFDEATGTLTVTSIDTRPGYINGFDFYAESESDGRSKAPWYDENNEKGIGDCHEKIVHVIIGENIPSVSSCCFCECPKLKTVDISHITDAIGNYAFKNCKNLKTVLFPESFTRIGEEAFRGCAKLKAAVFPGNLQVIGSFAFEGCAGLTSVTLPASLREIGKGAFASCRLSSVNVPEGTETRQWDFFYPANPFSALYHISLPAGVTDVGCGAFALNRLPPDMPECVIPEGITSISSEAFRGSNVRYVWLSDNTTRLDAGAFADCDNLKYIYIPWGCQQFGTGALPSGTTILAVVVSDELLEYAADYNVDLLKVEDPYAENL